MPKYFIADGEYAKSISMFTENMRDGGLLLLLREDFSKNAKGILPVAP
jgi:hypothetical protein